MSATDNVYAQTMRRLGDKEGWDTAGILLDAAGRLRASGDEETLAVMDFLATRLSLEREAANRKFDHLLNVIGEMGIVVEALAARSSPGQQVELRGIVDTARELIGSLQ